MARHTGFASLPLHGTVQAWLFQRMVRPSKEIVPFIAADQRRERELLRCRSDPFRQEDW